MSCCFEFLGSSSIAGAQDSSVETDKGSKKNDAYSILVAAVRSSREFQSQKHASAREAVKCFLEIAALACGFDLYFYSSRESRGRQAVIVDDDCCSPFRLIASSNRDAIQWQGAPIHHEAVLSGNYASVQTAKVTSDYGTEGILLVDFLPSSDGATLAEAVGLWAGVLGERLGLIETLLNEQALQKAVDSTLEIVSMMVFRAQHGDYNSCMQVGGDVIPEEMLTGSISPEHHTLWSLEKQEDELVQNDTGKYDGPRLPVSHTIVGMPVNTHKDKVVGVQHSNDEKYTQVLGSSSTICIPVTLPFDEVSASLSWRRTSTYSPQVAARLSIADSKNKALAAPTSDLAIVQLSWSSNGMQKPFDHFDLVCAEALPDTVLPKMIKLRDYFKRLDEVAHQREGLENVMEHLAKAATVTEVATLVESEVAEALRCEVCTFFFIDDKHDEIWAPPKDTLPEGLCMAFGVGLVGHVAKQAREAKDDDSLPSVQVTNDPQSSPYWKGDVAGFKTRNIMTAPVWSLGRDRRLLGVIQILNKAPVKKIDGSGKQVSNDVGFTNVDVEFLQLLCKGVGEILERLLLDVMCAKMNLDTHHRSKRGGGSSMAAEYYMSGPSTKTVYRAQECIATAMIMDKDKIEEEEVAFDKMLSTSAKLRADADMQNWGVDYWSLTQQEQFRLVLDALEECEVFSQLTVSRASLYEFFLKIRGTYRDLPYHNFWHALSTVHYVTRLVHAAGVTQNLTKADLFALVIGALCHDCDHRGHNTAFEVATRSDLAIRYNDNSPLENHHCAVAFDVALASASKSNIFEQLNPEVYINVRSRMIAGILSTDMKCHGDHVKLVQGFELREGVDTSQSQFLVELFMHAADIGNPYMPGHISRRWGTCINDEFTLQVQHEREHGLPVTGFMDGLADPVAAAKAQAGFIDFVVCPLVDPLFRIFEGLSKPKSFLKENREELKKKIANSSDK
mmetsp:Transcript_55118/g.101036  ORF Transcript_55118/g.101036 Transcript_55118/m.101036 type:complete len:958 (-) Transcript_55118:96-2969(-)